jgi:hypothetical protein
MGATAEFVGQLLPRERGAIAELTDAIVRRLYGLIMSLHHPARIRVQIRGGERFAIRHEPNILRPLALRQDGVGFAGLQRGLQIHPAAMHGARRRAGFRGFAAQQFHALLQFDHELHPLRRIVGKQPGERGVGDVERGRLVTLFRVLRDLGQQVEEPQRILVGGLHPRIDSRGGRWFASPKGLFAGVLGSFDGPGKSFELFGMDVAPPPLPEIEKPAFRLPWYAWLAWVLACILPIARAGVLGSRGALTPYEIGRVSGMLVGFLLLPTMVAWIAWRLSGRSVIARNIAFFGLLIVAFLGNTMRMASDARGQLAMNRAIAAQQKAEQLRREALANGKSPDSTAIREEQRKAAAARAEAMRSVSGDKKAILEADEAVNAGLRQAKAGYDAAVQELHVGNFFSLARLDSKETIATDRQHVQAFAAANKQLQDRIAQGMADFVREVRARNVSTSAEQQAVADYRTNSTPMLGPVAEIRESDGQLADVMLEFLDFADANFGEWNVAPGGGQVTFKSTDALARYNAIIGHLREVQARQAAAQQKLVGRRGPAPAAPKPGN